ncbi:hypothetical protein [Sandaracinobacteroides hominis]|uniref:hypothetical protein n=1 Tax=Sandaracinobacteroides hominis TaxID=2780086 RepID=UPI001A9CA658|nr:hypothetical protein [Sandaracinobacteroides hominis]
MLPLINPLKIQDEISASELARKLHYQPRRNRRNQMRRPEPIQFKSPKFAALAMFVGSALLLLASGPAAIALQSPSAVSPKASFDVL